MNAFSSPRIKAFTLCVGFFSLFGCKERTIIRPDLIPPVDNINTFELNDFGLVAEIKVQDSVVTNNYDRPMVGLGYISDDPFFGRTSMGAYLQFIQPGAASFSFPDNFQLDSAVLLLPYTSFSYGDTLPGSGNLQHFNIYRITEAMSREDSFKYYNFDVVATDPSPVGTGVLDMAQLTDSLVLPTGDTVAPHARFRLNNTFAQELRSADPSQFASTETFLNFFKGLYIAPDESQPQRRISYFGLLGSTTNTTARIAFMGKTDTTAQIYSFTFSSLATAYFNTIKRDYSGKPAAAYHNQPGLSDSIIIQEYPGFHTNITINGLDGIPKATINKAQLVFYALPVGGDAAYLPPMQLYPEGLDDEGNRFVLEDFILLGTTEGLQFVGGAPQVASINGQTYIKYTFNLPRALQKALEEGKSSLTLSISSNSVYPGSFRMVGAGPNGPDGLKASFNVIYTKQN